MTDIKDTGEALGQGPKKSIGKNKLFLIISGCALVVVLAVAAVLLFTGGSAGTTERVVEFGTVMQGVSVGGIDISGMTKGEALAATADLSNQLLSQVNFDVDIDGEVMTFTAQEFALYTDYEAVIEKAVAYGRAGTFDERLAAANAAKESSVDFPVDILVDEAGLKTALASFKSEMDTPPLDAAAIFAPWGYAETQNADGTVTHTVFEPTLEERIDIVKAYANRDEYGGFPAFVRIAEANMPNALRYEYYENDEFVEDYRPRDADISHFFYTDAVDGLVVDTGAIFDAVVSQVASDTYETIVAPVTVTPAAVTIEDMKSRTQLIASWSSSYSEHSSYNRNYNVAMMSSIINGAVLEPGQTFSVNGTAGPREAGTAFGWRKAAGLYNGGTTQQYGGGVCQLGSTIYNACIRSGVTIVEFSHHTIPSAYIPIGLDATLSTPTPDLVLGNDTESAFYIVSYVNPIERNVTVEVYGVPLTDASGQQILLTYDSERTGRYGSPGVKRVTVPYNSEAPDGHRVTSEYRFSSPRSGTTALAYQITMTLDGTEISRVQYGDTIKYPPFVGYTYVPDRVPETST
jgi:Uncharacterized vancomycin resistance protein